MSNFVYSFKKHLDIVKMLVSLTAMKLVYKMFIYYQLCRTYCMRIQTSRKFNEGGTYNTDSKPLTSVI
jgi:hypothetical protein